MVCRSTCFVLATASLIVPLLFVFLATSLSPWFNLVNNALSNLGHEIRNPVAIIFNSGLGIGGVLVGLYVARCPWGTPFMFSGIAAGITLTLVGVIDEYYGMTHFVVSVAFFLPLTAFLLVYVAIRRNTAKSVAALVALSIAIALWVTHFIYRAPRGAAIPELVSVFVFAPFYLDQARASPCTEHG